MKFSPATLIAHIDTALAADAKSRVECEAAIAKVRDRHNATWKSDHDPKWRRYRDQITALLKTGNPITPENAPKRPDRFEMNGDWEIRNEIADIRRGYGPLMTEGGRAEFKAIRATLEAIGDQEITDGQLGRLGFGAKSIAKIFRAATIEAAK
ncbi:hypothetical protein [Gordonia sp. MMO-8]|uniref:hypothetical protein n=1 Tax=Gordonia sp. MMO-8 TaxID=3127886 RepID=UPI003018D247